MQQVKDGIIAINMYGSRKKSVQSALLVSSARPEVESVPTTVATSPVVRQTSHSCILRQALFFEVIAEKADQRCSTFLLPQCGHSISPSS